jgi:hypothetical protein
MDFLSIALQCSFLPIAVGWTPEAELDSPCFVVRKGSGENARQGDRVTVDFWIQDESGKEIANSQRRGIEHSFDIFGKPGDPLLSAATLGAKPGEERVVILFAEDWLEETGPFSLIRNPGALVVRVRVSRVDRR